MSQPPAYGPYAPGPYGQAPTPPQSGGPAWTPPAPPAPRMQSSPTPWLAIVAVGLGLALVFAATFLAGRFTAPQSSAHSSTTTSSPPSAVVTTTPSPTAATTAPVPSRGTPTKGFTFDGRSLVGPNFTATLPSGWMVSETNGNDNDGEAVGPPGRMYYFAGGTLRAATICANIITTLLAVPNDPVTDVTDVRWGALNTVAKDVVTKVKDDAGTVTTEPIAYDVYCVDLPTGASSLLLSASTTAQHAATKAAAEQFLAAWTWR